MHGTDDQNVAINRTIDKVQMNTGISISRGEALHLMAGGKSRFNDRWFSGSSTGEVFRAAPSHEHKARKILVRAARLASATKLSA